MLVRFLAVVEEDAGIGRFGAADEEDDVVGAGEVLQLGYAVGDVAANGVVRFQRNIRFSIFDFRLDGLYEGVKTFHGFGGLGEEVDGAGEIESVELFGGFDDDCRVVGLSLETDHFGVSGFAVDDDLRRYGFVVAVRLVARADTILQFLDDRAGSIDDFASALLCDPVGRRGLAVCAEEYP